MKSALRWFVVLALMAAVAACTHRVTQPSTPEATTEQLRDWPNKVTGLVLRDGQTIDLPRSARVTVEGDSLIDRKSVV